MVSSDACTNIFVKLMLVKKYGLKYAKTRARTIVAPIAGTEPISPSLRRRR
jgi:hypothetical protein